MLFHIVISLGIEPCRRGRPQLATCHHQGGQDGQNIKERYMPKAEGTWLNSEKPPSGCAHYRWTGQGKKGANSCWKWKAGKRRPGGDNLEQNPHPASRKLWSHTEGRLEEGPRKNLFSDSCSLGTKPQGTKKLLDS